LYCQKKHTALSLTAAKKMERQETFRLLGNLPWRRPAGPSWPLKADRKVTPHGQVLPRRNYVYGLTAKTSMRSESVHHCMCPIFHAAAGRRGQKRRAQSALTRCASLHVPRFPHGSDAVSKDARAVTVKFASVVAGNCLFDMASKGCGQKRHTIRTGTTIWQQESYA